MILIVDDEPIIHTLMRGFCDQYGVDHMSMLNGLGAANMARAHDVNIVFLDILMDGQEGLKTLGELKHYCKCCVVTMSSDQHYLDVSLDLGADYALKKPITYEDFCQVLNNEKCTNKPDFHIKGNWS